MLYPSIDHLMRKADSKYSLVVLASKRARQLLNDPHTTIKAKSKKRVGVALEELAADILFIPVQNRRK